MAKQTFTTGQVLTAAQMTSLQQTAMGGGSPSTKTASYVLVAADAGTTIQMNSSSATTITVNTSLFSAGDSVQIQNIGTGSLTITAGTATVNTAGGLAVTQWDGGFLYFSSASSAIWFDYTQSGLTNPMTTTGDIIYASSGSTPARLGIGSTGNVLTVAGGVPTWAAPAGGGLNWTLLNTGGTALTGSNSTTISGISGKEYLMAIVISARSGSANSVFNFIINSDTGSNYRYAGSQIVGLSTYSASITDRASANLDTYIEAGYTSSNAACAVAASLFIQGGTSTGIKSYQVMAGPNSGGGNSQKTMQAQGIYQGSAAITSLSFRSSSGNFDLGTLFVYGA
jgi:hypothetical protein